MIPFLQAKGIHKHFPGVHAVKNVDVEFFPGETVAVIGENGAGKSTLMKILAGVHTPDSGEILVEGTRVSIDNVSKATALGIAFIHQELNLADNLTIGANVFLGREPTRFGSLKIIHRESIRKATEDLLLTLGMKLSPDTLVRDLSIGQQQMVEIAKALSMNAKLIIMDEPTSSLTCHETEQLFRVVSQLKQSGTSIVFISHRLKEISGIADRVIGLRDGQNSGALSKEEISHDKMVALMVGRSIDQFYQHTTKTSQTLVMEVESLHVPMISSKPFSFKLFAGEILGVAGLVGAGRTELSRVLFGIDSPASGTIRVNSRVVKPGIPREAIKAGIALVPEDRKQQGLILEMSIRDNMALPQLGFLFKKGFVKDAVLTEQAENHIRSFGIRCTAVSQEVQMLSGGNQQKVVLAKWMAMKPHVLILDEPTRGVDVRSKSEIYQLLETMAANGVAIMMISSDMEEILHISDRVMVMHDGRVTGFLEGEALCEEQIMDLATGNTTQSTAIP
jgi:ribose transport system ATP-binding protein